MPVIHNLFHPMTGIEDDNIFRVHFDKWKKLFLAKGDAPGISDHPDSAGWPKESLRDQYFNTSVTHLPTTQGVKHCDTQQPSQGSTNLFLLSSFKWLHTTGSKKI